MKSDQLERQMCLMFMQKFALDIILKTNFFWQGMLIFHIFFINNIIRDLLNDIFLIKSEKKKKKKIRKTRRQSQKITCFQKIFFYQIHPFFSIFFWKKSTY